MCIPLAVYCVIRRVSPTNSKFHPRSGFIPTKADLVKKDCNFISKLQSFFGGQGWIRTTEGEYRQIYSLLPLAARQPAHILELAIGIEPTTC